MAEIFEEGVDQRRARDEEAQAGTLKSGRSGRKVKSRKQAIAIGLSEARAEGRQGAEEEERGEEAEGEAVSAHRHCEERSDEAIQTVSAGTVWIASLRSQ